MSWDGELQALEAAIGRLNAEYDAFLYGSASRPPVESRRSAQRILRRLSSQEPESAAEQYRLATLQGRYNALCERWDRLEAEKESGRRPGVYGGFARHSRRVATATESPATHKGRANAAGAGSVESGSNADQDAELYARYVTARRARGEDVAGLKLAGFKQSLAKEREKLKGRLGTADIDFEVAERDGRIKLVARRRVAATPESDRQEKT